MSKNRQEEVRECGESGEGVWEMEVDRESGVRV